MMLSKSNKPKKPEPNPIETAIGNRTKEKGNLADLPENAVLTPVPQVLEQIPDEPSPSEMLSLEELNRQTEKRLQDKYLEQEQPEVKKELRPVKNYPEILVSQPDPPPVTKTSSLALPPQGVEKKEVNPGYFKIQISAEDIELTNLKKYILEDGFVESAIAFHIVTLCSQPLVITPTTAWAFKDRAKIPEMVLALLNQPGYIEGVWPSLKIIMGSNAGNSAWSAGVLMTIALFDVVRTLPAIEELKNESVDSL